MRFKERILIFFCSCFFILPGIIHAGVGDTLKRITVPVASPTGIGVSIEADCDGNLYYTNYSSAFLYKMDKNGTLLDTKPLTDAANGMGIYLDALAWDNTRQMLWSGSNGNIYLIDPATGIATLKFTDNNHWFGILDGIAYDHSDNTIWVSGDAVSWIDHYMPDGTFLGTLIPSIGGASISGVQVGLGDLLYLGTSGTGEIMQVKKSDGSFISSFTTIGGRDEDLGCDMVNFAPKLAIWSKDAYDNTVYAIEVPALTCACSECITDTINNPQAICNGASYLINSHTYSTAGTYYDTIPKGSNCNSIIITTLTINPTNPDYIQNVSASICNGDNYIFPDGTSSSVSVIHTSNLNPIVECDSIIVTTLTVNPTYTQNISASVCSGSVYTFPDGSTSSSATTHTSNLVSANGCDSSIVTTLSINPAYSLTGSAFICFGDIYTFPDGTTSSVDVTHTSNLTTISGCDSIISTTLRINPSHNLNISASICDGDLYLFPDGYIAFTPTTHTSNLYTIAGCDSIIVTDLSVNPLYSQNVSATICSGEVYTFPDGTSSAGASVHLSNLLSQSGCDSVIITDLAVSSIITQDLIPNIFTPNTDNINESFRPFSSLPDWETSNLFEIYELIIFNRWGVKIFQSSDPKQSWNGKTLSGSEAAEGVYYWIVNFKSKCSPEGEELTGFVHLLR
jgi:gliding motility-associated-like protein